MTRIRIQVLVLLSGVLLYMVFPLAAPASKKNSDSPGDITGKSVFAGLSSLIIWPGIGQALNDNPGKKVTTHAIFGLLPPYRLWSGYDALLDRKGGYWNGKI